MVLNVRHKTTKSTGDILYADEWNDYHEGEIRPEDINLSVMPSTPKEGDLVYNPSTKHLYVYIPE